MDQYIEFILLGILLILFYNKPKFVANLPNNKILTGSKINKISSKPEDIIPRSDMVFVSSPVSAYSEIFSKIVPHLDSNTIIQLSF